MKKIREENLLAGSTGEAQDGIKSCQSMKHGEEGRDMLLALLNSPLETLLNNQQAKVLGTCFTKSGQATIVIFYGVLPTGAGLLRPAEEEKDEKNNVN